MVGDEDLKNWEVVENLLISEVWESWTMQEPEVPLLAWLALEHIENIYIYVILHWMLKQVAQYIMQSSATLSMYDKIPWSHSQQISECMNSL